MNQTIRALPGGDFTVEPAQSCSGLAMTVPTGFVPRELSPGRAAAVSAAVDAYLAMERDAARHRAFLRMSPDLRVIVASSADVEKALDRQMVKS